MEGTMSEKWYLKISLILLIMLLILGCAISFGGSSKDDDIESLKLELTRQALQLTQQAIGNSGSQSSPSQPDQSSSDNQPEAVAPEPEPTATIDETPCNESQIIGETIKDGTVFKPGETFKKTWTLRNDGDCDWTTGYTFKFIEGTRMGGSSSTKVPSVIEPEEAITFKVNLTAPNDPGEYKGVWQLFAEDGEKLGWYWVEIVVEDDRPPFAVTSISTNITDKTFSGACPQTIDVEIYIKVNGPGTITYQPETSDLGLAPVDTIDFNDAGTDTETYTWTIQNPGNYWLKVHIPDPNNQTFGPFNMTINCP